MNRRSSCREWRHVGTPLRHDERLGSVGRPTTHALRVTVSKDASIIPLKYHQAAFNLIGVAPEFDPVAEKVLSGFERERDFQFPASVREWYSQRGAAQLLEQRDSCIEAVSVEELGRPQKVCQPTPEREIDPIPEGHLTFLDEVQGGTSWTARLDGSDDPPVFVAEGGPNTERHEACDRFSTFNYCHLWDFRIAQGREAWVVVERFDDSLQATLDLASPFMELPRTHFWPQSTEYRFQWEDQAVLIQKNGDSYLELSLSANDSDSLANLLTRFGNILTAYSEAQKRVTECSKSCRRHFRTRRPRALE